MMTKYEFTYAKRTSADGVLDALEEHQQDGWECINITHRQGLYGNEFVVFFRRPLP